MPKMPDPDYDIGSEYDDCDDEWEFDCGLAPDGQCSKAGSEECDFSCPYRNSELFAGSAAWRRKQGEAMSNRTLLEINHDLWHVIAANPKSFSRALFDYLATGSSVDADKLRKYGFRVFGMRHHSEAFSLDWGGIQVSEKESPKR